MKTKQQIINGIVAYIDSQIMPVVDTKAKWILGTTIPLLAKSPKGIEMFKYLDDLGLEHDGMYELDEMFERLMNAARTYGKMTISLPLVGEMTFGIQDIEMLQKFIREAL